MSENMNLTLKIWRQAGPDAKGEIKAEMKDRLNDYYGSRYELRNQPEAVEGRVNNMLEKLQHMFGV